MAKGNKNANVNASYTSLSPEEAFAKRSAASKKANEVTRQRRLFRDIFNEQLVKDNKCESIADMFICALFNDDYKLSDRIQVFELMLRILGEPGFEASSADWKDIEKIKLLIN